MTTPEYDQALADVLDAYVAASGVPSHAALTAWTRRYPHYARELAEFTATWSLARHLPPSTAPTAGEAALLRQGMRVVEGLLREKGIARPAVQPPIASLLEEGRAHGLAAGALAERAGLSIPLVLKLDRRLIRAATIPLAVVERVARAVERDAAAVAAYLQGTPRLAQGASYHAAETPTLGEQEDFAAAVRRDLTLPEERRAQLLALDPPTSDAW